MNDLNEETAGILDALARPEYGSSLDGQSDPDTVTITVLPRAHDVSEGRREVERGCRLEPLGLTIEVHRGMPPVELEVALSGDTVNLNLDYVPGNSRGKWLCICIGIGIVIFIVILQLLVLLAVDVVVLVAGRMGGRHATTLW